jgi:uncharacterized protein (TIGR03083 family)
MRRGNAKNGGVTDDDPRAALAAAAAGFTELVAVVGSPDWERPGLGEWDVRGLVGHASRALSTIETYLSQPAAGDGPVISDPAAYFVLNARARRDRPEAGREADAAIAERGRAAGAALGDDPAAAVAELAARVLALVAATPGDTLVTLPSGARMPLDAYLPTRMFELAVHSVDLARALGTEVPGAARPAITAACELAGRVAGQLPQAGDALLVLTGRPAPPGGLSIV